MDIRSFLLSHNSHPSQINSAESLNALVSAMKQGLEGQGNIPMIPSYLSTDIPSPTNQSCCVLDAGGTNLRSAAAHFDAFGNCTLSNVRKQPMPGTYGPMSSEALYQMLAAEVLHHPHDHRVGFCFSYNVTINRHLDGVLDAWCKEVQVPDAVGKPVGSTLKSALGPDFHKVHVLNDSVAALLGSTENGKPAQIGLILGTGVNVCYEEKCANILKIQDNLNADRMIISTEIGEFSGITKSTFDDLVISGTSDPELAQAEKQCAGGYLGQQICLAWAQASQEGLLPAHFEKADYSLGDISCYLSDSCTETIPDHPIAKEIATTLIERAAKIAAILCAGPILISTEDGASIRIAIEGSQFWKLTGFRPVFLRELNTILAPYNIYFEISHTENACLLGAALAAFADPM